MNYMGSKSRIAKYIVPIIQKCIDDNNIRLFEPKSYHYLIRYLYKHPLNVKGD